MSEPSTNTETFDVFLCHNSEDKPEIRKIARQLTENGIKPWLDENQIQPGELWQNVLVEKINNIK
ncbi:MAG: toll/interleukin-1 receptor domain-containing protein, partial [Deltaproteobacteria bacterium]|nr:toll/interleukin-1 receptor domain-containing protein [Deltaproteobacteria bacterium]